MICVAGSLLALAACDPASLVEKKVPEPIKKILTFSSSAAKRKPAAKKALEKLTLQIISPRNDNSYPLDRPVVFQAVVEPKGAGIKKKDVVWTLTEVKARKGGKPSKSRVIGRGMTLVKKFPAGSYRVQAKLSPGKGLKLTQTARFAVEFSVPGRVVFNDGGLFGADFVLTDLRGMTAVARARSGKDGSFFIAVPPGGPFKLVPRKAGFSFAPPYRLIHRGLKLTSLDFSAAKSKIEEMLLTGSPDSDGNLRVVCPEQETYIKVKLDPGAKVTRLTAHLVPDIKGAKKIKEAHKPLIFTEAAYSGDSAVAGGESGPTTIKVKVPVNWKRALQQTSYRLRVTAQDVNGNSFSSESPNVIRIDMEKCLLKKFEEAVSLHGKGDLKAALKIYNLIQKIGKELADSVISSGEAARILFNRGLAYLQMAVSLDAEDMKRVGYLSKALEDFRRVLALDKRDAEALLMRGWVTQLRNDPDTAVKFYNQAITANADLAEAYEMRARAYLATKLKKNLSRAVDDFTAAIGINPGDDSLRKSRRETLKLDVEHDAEDGNTVVNISSILLDKIGKRLALDKFRRK